METIVVPAFSPGSKDEPAADKIRVLLVYDHPLVRQGLHTVLDFYPDLEVAEASNGEEAIMFLEHFKASVVLLDINMPRKNGVQTTAEILSRYPHIKVIGLSVDCDVVFHEAMKRAGAEKVLSKETVVEDLYEAIRGVLGRS